MACDSTNDRAQRRVVLSLESYTCETLYSDCIGQLEG